MKKIDISFSELSKKVGFSRPPSSYPKNLLEIKKASDEQIVIWFRFCATAKSHKQIELINEVSKRFKAIASNK